MTQIQHTELIAFHGDAIRIVGFGWQDNGAIAANVHGENELGG